MDRGCLYERRFIQKIDNFVFRDRNSGLFTGILIDRVPNRNSSFPWMISTLHRLFSASNFFLWGTFIRIRSSILLNWVFIYLFTDKKDWTRNDELLARLMNRTKTCLYLFTANKVVVNLHWHQQSMRRNSYAKKKVRCIEAIEEYKSRERTLGQRIRKLTMQGINYKLHTNDAIGADARLLSGVFSQANVSQFVDRERKISRRTREKSDLGEI